MTTFFGQTRTLWTLYRWSDLESWPSVESKMMNRLTRCKWFGALSLFCFLVLGTGRAFGGNLLSSGELDTELKRKQGELIRAIWSHDLNTFQGLLEQGVNPNFLFPDGNVSPLSEAIAEHQPKMIALLLDYGADVNFGAEHGLVPLSVAAWYDDPDTVIELLKRGAKIEARDDEGYTALLKAASQAQGLKVIKILIESGADVRARTNNRGDTALMLAAYKLNSDAVRLFVQMGLDPCVHNNDDKTAVDYAKVQVLESDAKAKLKARKEILELLMNRCNVATHLATPGRREERHCWGATAFSARRALQGNGLFENSLGYLNADSAAVSNSEDCFAQKIGVRQNCKLEHVSQS